MWTQQAPTLKIGTQGTTELNALIAQFEPLVQLRAVKQDEVDAAYVSSCDVPLLLPEFIREMIRRLGPHELAVPREGDFHHPLAAVYRTSLRDSVRQLVSDKRLRPLFRLRAPVRGFHEVL